MMLHQDASRFAWLGGEAEHDRVVTMDDATSAIYSAFLVAEEGTASTLRGLGGPAHNLRRDGAVLDGGQQQFALGKRETEFLCRSVFFSNAATSSAVPAAPSSAVISSGILMRIVASF